MDILDQLIKSLEDAKIELQKNLNCTPGATTMNKEEMDKAAISVPSSSPVVGIPASQVKEAKIKHLQSKIDAGTYKPDPKKIADKMIKEELTCSENGQWNLMEKSIYNVGVSQANMPGRQSKVGNFPHYDYDTSSSHEDNIKQAKAHFDKHKIKLNDTQFHTHMKQAKAQAESQEK